MNALSLQLKKLTPLSLIAFGLGFFALAPTAQAAPAPEAPESNPPAPGVLNTGIDGPGYNRRQAPAIKLTGAPQYRIFDIGVVQVGDSVSEGFGVSHGGIAVGRSERVGASQAFTWTQGGGIA